jgi:hypothetical protein
LIFIPLFGDYGKRNEKNNNCEDNKDVNQRNFMAKDFFTGCKKIEVYFYCLDYPVIPSNIFLDRINKMNWI